MSVRHPRLLAAYTFGALLALALILPATGGATLPGLNGRIVFNKAVEKSETDFEIGIWSTNPDGTGLTQLVGGEKDASDATYSPDGTRLVWDFYDEIWTAAADGSGAHVLSPGNDRETEVTRWVHNYEDPETHVKAEWVRIHEKREERDAYSDASFSPDGKELAVVHYTGADVVEERCQTTGDKVDGCSGPYSQTDFRCEDCFASIDAIDSTTGAPLGTLVPRTTDGFISRPSWASTGAVAFEWTPTEEFSNREVRVAAAPGATPVTLVAGEAGEPDFSPDGSRVVFAHGRHEIGIVPVTGGTPTYVTVPEPEPGLSVYSAQSPVWSPDGTSIAFADLGVRPESMRYTQGGVFVMRPDGSGATQLQGGVGAVPTGWQPVPQVPAKVVPAPPVVRARAVAGKKKLRLNRKGLATVGSVVCGSSSCALKATKPKLRIGKRTFGVKAIVAGALAPGATTKVKVKVKGKALAALRAAHHGKLSLTLSVSDTAGTESLTFAPKLLPPAPKHHHKGKHLA